MNYCFPEPGVYKFSDAMGKSITHLTCLGELTVCTCNLTQNFKFFMQLEKLLDIHQTLVINCSNKICIQLKSIIIFCYIKSSIFSNKIDWKILLINFVSEERSMYVQIPCSKNQLIIAKNNVWFSINQLNCWSCYLQETLNPARGQSSTTRFSFIFLLHRCDNLMRL